MQSILAAFDLSDEGDSTEAILEAISRFAKAGCAQVRVVHSFQPQIFIDAYTTDLNPAALAAETMAAEKLEAIRNRLESAGTATTARMLFGDPGSSIVAAAKAFDAELVILGNPIHSALRHLLMGSTTMFVLKNSPCPVLVTPAGFSKAPDAATPVVSVASP